MTTEDEKLLARLLLDALDDIKRYRETLESIALLEGDRDRYASHAGKMAREALEPSLKPMDNLSCGGSGSCCQGPCRARW